MGKFKLKKAGKAMRRAGKGVVRVAEEVAEVVEVVVAVAGLVEEIRQATRRLPAQPPPARRDEARPRVPGADA